MLLLKNKSSKLILNHFYLRTFHSNDTLISAGDYLQKYYNVTFNLFTKDSEYWWHFS